MMIQRTATPQAQQEGPHKAEEGALCSDLRNLRGLRGGWTEFRLRGEQDIDSHTEEHSVQGKQLE